MPIPEKRPGCDRALYVGYLNRPAPQWQPRAKLLLLIGAMISGPILLSAPFLATEVLVEFDPNWQLKDEENGTVGLIVWVPVIIVSLIPAMAFGAIAFHMPRKFKFHCKDCGWTETIILPTIRYGRHAKVDPDRLE